MKHKKKFILAATTMVVVLAILVLFCAVYVNAFYHADMGAVDAFAPENHVEKQVWEDNTLVYAPENAEAGFIFYPGGKVEYVAYEPLMESLATSYLSNNVDDFAGNLCRNRN